MHNATKTILFKEFKAYFSSPIAYIFITLFLVVTTQLFFMNFFIANDANMRSYFALLPWIFLLFVPAISMRLVAEERRSGTIELLMTLPVTEWQVVLGKYFSSLLFLAVSVLLSFPIVVMLYYLGSPDLGPIIGGYLGGIFMGAAYLAIGLFVSSITQNQIVAFIVSAIIIFAFLLLGLPAVLFNIPSFLVPLFKWLSLYDHFTSIARGVVDLRDIFYYLSMIVFFLFLSHNALKNRS